MSESKLVSAVALDGVDMFTGLSSIFTLTVISLERLFAISRPLRHRQLSSHNYAIAIATPWILSLAVTSVRVFQHYSIVTHHQVLTVIIASLSTPLLITCTSYYVIWRKQTSRIQNRIRAKRELRLSKTLFFDNRNICFDLATFPSSSSYSKYVCAVQKNARCSHFCT